MTTELTAKWATISQQAIEDGVELWLTHDIVSNLNLGQYRSEIKCSCGHTYVTDGHSEERQECFIEHQVADLLTVLEQQIREQVAREILDERIDGTAPLDRLHNALLELAAVIARGNQQ